MGIFEFIEMDMLFMMIAFSLGAYVLVFGFLRKVNEWMYVRTLGEMQYSLPPGDMGWPFAGKMLTFLRAFRSSDPDSFITGFVDRYGRTGIYRTVMFGKPCIIICSPETCRLVLADDENFRLGYPESTQFLIGKRSLHDVPPAEHKHLRRVTAALLNGSEALSRYIKHTEAIMIASLDEWASMNQPIEFFTEMKRAAFDIILEIFLGPGNHPHKEKMLKLFSDVGQGLNSLAINFPGFAYHKAVRAKNELVKILQEALGKRKLAKESDASAASISMLDALMSTEDVDGGKLEDEKIVDILLMYFIGGYESTAMAMMWVLLYLDEHPDIFKKAKEEQIQILERRDSMQKGLSFQETKQMEYLAKVLDETLRRANLAFAVFRVANTDVQINGYTIPRGWKVLVSPRAVHMDPEIFREPREFNHSRWTDHRIKPGSFLPFGAGSRSCPGNELAKLEMFIFLHHYLLNYKLERINPKCRMLYLPGPKPADNLLAKFKRVS